MNVPTPSRTAELSNALSLCVMRLARRLRQQRVDLSLTLTQLATLAVLDRHGQLTPRELASHEKVQPPSMTRTLAALEERQLVARAPHPTDGRQHVVSLTPRAREMIHEDRRRRDAWLARQLLQLTPEEREILRKAMPVLERLGTL